MKLLSTAAVLTFLLAGPASAEPKSWTAAKGVLSDHVTVVAGANLGGLRTTSMYRQLVPTLIDQEAGVKLAFEMTKSACAIDLHTSIEDATVAIGNDHHVLIVLGLAKGLDHKRLLECLNKVATHSSRDQPVAARGGLEGGVTKRPVAKVTAKTDGKITAYTIAGDARKLYVAWLAPDVVAFSSAGDDRAVLEKLIAGSGITGTLGGVLGRVKTSSTVWLATTKRTPIQQTGSTMKAAFGTVQANQGTVAVDLHAIMGSASEAKKFVGDATAMIAAAKSQVPPAFRSLVEAVKLAAIGEAASLKLSVSEQDLLAVLRAVM